MARTRFEIVRQCELDMRCLVRDQAERRVIIDEIGQLHAALRKGKIVNQVQLDRLKIQRNLLSAEILERFDRLHRRMDRNRAEERDRVNALAERRAFSGHAAHA